jgi:hypothetical protein
LQHTVTVAPGTAAAAGVRTHRSREGCRHQATRVGAHSERHRRSLLLLGATATSGLVERFTDVLARQLDLDDALDLAENSIIRDSLALLVLVDHLRLAPNFLNGTPAQQGQCTARAFVAEGSVLPLLPTRCVREAGRLCGGGAVLPSRALSDSTQAQRGLAGSILKRSAQQSCLEREKVVVSEKVIDGGSVKKRMEITHVGPPPLADSASRAQVAQLTFQLFCLAVEFCCVEATT